MVTPGARRFVLSPLLDRWEASEGMAPTDPLRPEDVARAIVGLPAVLFVGDVSGPLNAEASSLAEKLDPKLEKIQADIDATLELCHAGNEPSAGSWKNDVHDVRAGVQSIQNMVTRLLNGTYVAPRARERLHREASLSSFGRAARPGTEQESTSPDQEFVLEL